MPDVEHDSNVGIPDFLEQIEGLGEGAHDRPDGLERLPHGFDTECRPFRSGHGSQMPERLDDDLTAARFSPLARRPRAHHHRWGAGTSENCDRLGDALDPFFRVER